MTKAFYLSLAAYNRWANGKAAAWLAEITDDQWQQTVASSFESVMQTAIHIASAQKIWVDFWKAESNPVYLSSCFTGTKSELIHLLLESSKNLQAFIENYPEENYTNSISFLYPDGRKGAMPFWQTVSHIINHSTYHRGQLVTLLRNVGYTNFSSTDLATYCLLHLNEQVINELN